MTQRLMGAPDLDPQPPLRFFRGPYDGPVNPLKRKVVRWQRSTDAATVGDRGAEVPRIWPLTPYGGTVIIMNGLHELALPQVLHCKAAFEALGYNVVLCKGLAEKNICNPPPTGSGHRTSVAWGAVCIPKLVSILESQGYMAPYGSLNHPKIIQTSHRNHPETSPKRPRNVPETSPKVNIIESIFQYFEIF